MDYQVLMQMVSTLGFPIVCVFMMFYYVKYLNDTHSQEITQLRQDMIASNEELRKSIEANTLVTTKLYERMSTGHD
jgi:hypothetical protein|nr:MAG TPA: YvrJ protein family protein [Caudoviricetes sp.]